MFGALGDLGGLMKKAQDFKTNLKKAKDEIAVMEAEGSSGNGMVQVVAGGDLSLKKITINPEAIDSEDIEILEDLVLLAVNDAFTKIRVQSQEKLNAAKGDLNIPGFDLDF